MWKFADFVDYTREAGGFWKIVHTDLADNYMFWVNSRNIQGVKYVKS